MKLLKVINESTGLNKLDNKFYRKCLNYLDQNIPELREFITPHIYDGESYSGPTFKYSRQSKIMSDFFKKDLGLDDQDTNNLIFLYLINIDVDDFLTDPISVGNGLNFSFVTATSPDIEENYGSEWEPCGECDGEASVECDECNGAGSSTCDFCDGYGEINDGDDEYECPDCNGDGEINCTVCGGEGYVPCKYCGGEGKVEQDTLEYSLDEIEYWLITSGELNTDFTDVGDFFEKNKENILILITREIIDTITSEFSADLPTEGQIINVNQGQQITTFDIEFNIFS